MAQRDRGARGSRLDLRGVNLDTDKYLADALGITVAELNTAQEKANAAELTQAVADGRMTQEQADLVTAKRALQQYIQDKGLWEQAVASAVKDGVITQAQADTILADAKPGAFDFGGRGEGGRGGMHGMGRGGHGPAQNGSAPSDTQSQGNQS